MNIGGAGWGTWKAQSKDTVHLYEPTSAQIAAGTTFEFRVTAYDTSIPANASTVSATSTATAALKTGPEVLTGMGILGWQFPGIFSATDYRVVAWTAATLTLGSGTTYSIGAGNTGNMAALTYIYFDPAVSTIAFQVTTTAATAVGANKLLIAVGKNVADIAKKAEFQTFGGGGGLGKLFTADNIAANAITANEIAANTIVAGNVAAGTLTGTEVSATANFTCGSSNDIIRISGNDATYRLWIGHATAASAPFRVTKGGVLTATGMTIATAASGERLVISSAGSGQHMAGYNSSNYETVSIFTSDATLNLSASATAYLLISPAEGFKGTSGSAFYALHMSGTSEPELWLKDSAGLTKVQLEAEGGGRLKFAGTQVVGNQGAAIADATDAASAITQLNLLLARCRTHGLIAT